MDKGTVKARWVGPFAAEVPDIGTIQPGDVLDVDPGVLNSAHWERVAEPHAAKAPAVKPEGNA